MQICDDFNHEDIVYTGKNCPLCEALEQIKELEEQLEEQVKEL